MVATETNLLARNALQSLKRGLTGKRLALIGITTTLLSLHITLLAQGGNQGIVAKLIMVVEILVSQTQPIDPLCDQLLNGVLGIPGSPTIDEAAGELLKYPATQINLTEQQPTGVGSDSSPVECRHDLTTSKGLKLQLFFRTLLM